MRHKQSHDYTSRCHTERFREECDAGLGWAQSFDGLIVQREVVQQGQQNYAMQEGRKVCDIGCAIIENRGTDEGIDGHQSFVKDECDDATSADKKWYEDSPTFPWVQDTPLHTVSEVLRWCVSFVLLLTQLIGINNPVTEAMKSTIPTQSTSFNSRKICGAL